jgi:hypothetical protein
VLLSRNTEKWWTAEAVAEELGVSAGSMAHALDGLCAHNLLDVKIGQSVLFRFAPRESEAALVKEVIEAYRTRRIAVLQLLTQRVDSLREFADAFRLGKKKGPNDG